MNKNLHFEFPWRVLFKNSRFLLVFASVYFTGSVFSQAISNQKNKIASYENAKQNADLLLKSSQNRIWFEENKGQLPPSVLYSFRTNFGVMFIERDALLMVPMKEHEPDEDPAVPFEGESYTEKQYVRLTFEGSNPEFNIAPKRVITSGINYMNTEKLEDFVYGVRAFGELYFNDVYPGVDLRLYSVKNGELEFDWILNRAEDYKLIRMNAVGHEGIELSDDGGFKIKCRFDNLNFRMPESYQIIENQKKTVDIKYQLEGENTLTFADNEALVSGKPLVIDPTVLWATYLQTGSYLFASESDNCGRVYCAGRFKDGMNRTSYLQGAVGYQTTAPIKNESPIIYMFSADGDSIKSLTYFGQEMTPQDLELFPNGNVIVGGSRRDKNGKNGGSISPSGGLNAYSTASDLWGWVAIFNSELTSLLYSSHAPGSTTAGNATITSGGGTTTGHLDEFGITSIEILSDTSYIIAGITDLAIATSGGTVATQRKFVSSSAPDVTFGGTHEAYISKFGGNNFNQFRWGTYVGGSNIEEFFSIKLSPDKTKLAFAGNFTTATISGGLYASFPTLVNAVDGTADVDDGFVGVISNIGATPTTFSMLSYLGGSNMEGDFLVECRQDYVYVMGYTSSSTFPGIISGTSFDATYNGDYDVFVSRIPINGSAGSGFRSTFFGGDRTDISGGMIFNTNDNNLYLFITTGSESATLHNGNASGATNPFPVKNTNPPSNFYDGRHGTNGGSWQPEDANGIGKGSDLCFATISPDLTTNIFTTFCGGSERDYLGNTGRLAGTGHYGFNPITNIYTLGTTIHSAGTDMTAQGSGIWNPLSCFDSTAVAGDDHLIIKYNLSNTDMGDAPASYDGGNPARHGTNAFSVKKARFGSALTDYDSKVNSSVLADGDDKSKTGADACSPGSDDEDGLSVIPTISVESTGTYNLTLSVYNNTDATAKVYGWIDFNGNGTFEANEADSATVTTSTSTGRTVVLGWPLGARVCPSSIKGGRTYARFRIGTTTVSDTVSTTTLDERSHGIIQTGEVEDHLIYIRGRDYGDLPVSYGTASAMVYEDANEDGVPETAGAVWLGSVVDIEKDCAANNSADAKGDDNENTGSGGDDEDGVTFPSGVFKSGQNKNFTLSFGKTTPASTVHYGMWIDWNADGDFTDGTDGFYSGSTTGSSAVVNVTAPTGSNFSPYFAVRTMVRTTAFAAGDYAANFVNGEVEDNINYPGVLISGTVYDDGDGTYDLAVDGTPGSAFNNPSGTQLWAYLSLGGTIIDSMAVLPNGTYFLQGANPSTPGYSVSISTTRVAIGGSVPSVTLPSNWSSVGETYGANNTAGSGIEGLTPSANSIVAVTTGTIPITGLDFGINLAPESNNVTSPCNTNSGTPQFYQVTGLNGTDAEQGTLSGDGTGMMGKTVIIKSLPPTTGGAGAGAAEIYYNGVQLLSANLPIVIANYDSTLLQVDPLFIGVGTVTFTYVWRDSAQVEDASAATVTLNFCDPSVIIGGTVRHDANGLTDGIVNGSGIGSPDGTQLYAYLDSAGFAVRKVTLPASGVYSFSAQINKNYTVVISATSVSIKAATPLTADLPANWASTGEDYGSPNGAGSGVETGTPDSRIAVNVGTSNITAIDFGIEKTPVAHDKSYNVNPNQITGLTGQGIYGTFGHWMPLNKAVGTTDGVLNSNDTAVYPGKVSGLDLEDGKFDGSTGTMADSIAFKSLPDTSHALLVYQINGVDVLLWPTPQVSDPSYVYWDGSKYVIQDFNADSLKMYFKFNYQDSNSFQYAYYDNAGLLGSFATYTIKYQVPLPVYISNMVCNVTSQGVRLNWVIHNMNEINTMSVLRSSAGNAFEPIYYFSNLQAYPGTQTFSYLDQNPGEGVVSYKIRTTDVDRNTNQSEPCTNSTRTGLKDLQISVAPNPTEGYTVLSITSPEDAQYNIELMDFTGKTIIVKQLNSVDGAVNEVIEMRELSDGVYFLNLKWNGNHEVIKIMKN